MGDYKIAIPSYNRASTLKKATLNVLNSYNIDSKKIHIFVANKQQEKLYRNALGNKYKIIVGKKGIRNIRNCMPNYFPENQKIIYFDDDIYEINECIYSKTHLDNYLKRKKLTLNKENREKNKKSGYKLIKLKNLDKFIKEGFKECERTGYNLFGVYPAYNAYFMKPTNKNKNHIGYKLRYIIGFLCGTINKKLPETRTVDDKEDYERSINYYLHDGGVIRFNNTTAKTKCYHEPGGMQSEGHRTAKRVELSAKYLAEKYNDLCKLRKTKKKSGWFEVTMADKRNNKIFGPKVVRKYLNKSPKTYDHYIR